MAFKGKQKTDYQRNYMKKKRLVVKRMLAERYGIPIKRDADGYIIPGDE